jgi:hypothetical protein
MHIHGNPMGGQMMVASQAAQQASAARREALAVRKKLTDFSGSVDGEDVTRVASDPDAEPDSRQNRKQQSDDESFKSVFFSFTV